MRTGWLLAATVATAACGDNLELLPDAGPDAPPAPAAVARFVPPAPGGGGDWGAVPFPSDLYLNAMGRLELDTLPVGDQADAGAVTMLQQGLGTLGGSGLRTNVYFPIEGAGTLDGVTVELVDLESSARISVRTIWRDDLDAIVAIPPLGTVLAPDHRYGAILRAPALARDNAFAAAVDFATTPSDPAIAAAQESLRPLLEGHGDLDSIVSATVFRTANYVRQTQRMREVVAATPPAATVDAALIGDAALDAVLGDQTDDAVPGTCRDDKRAQPHGHVAALVQGTITLTSFLSSSQNEDGQPEYDVTGEPIVKGAFPVHYTLSLPAAGDYSDLPVVLYVHDLQRSRLDLATQIDTAARQGFAVLAIDLPYHGHRARRAADQLDQASELLGTTTPDGFGDTSGFAAAADLFHFAESGGLAPQHPRAIGENLRQGAVELVELVAFVQGGDDTAIETAIGATITFRDDVGIVADSVGADLAGIALAVEPGLGVAYLSAPAAGFPDLALLHSPNYATDFAATLAPYDVDDRIDRTDPDRDVAVDPIGMLVGNVVERGDALAYAPLITSGALRAGVAPDVVVTMTWGDVWIPDDAQEAFAKAMNLPIATMALANPPASPTRFATFTPIAWPVAANLAGGASGCFVVLAPAGHAALRRYQDQRNFEPEFPPFVPLSPPVVIFPNGVQQAHELWSETFADHFDGGGAAIDDPFADADTVTSGSSCN